MTENQPGDAPSVIRISFDEMKAAFARILTGHGFSEEKAERCAGVFAENSLDGVYSHGVNRFPRFIEYVRKKFVLVDEEPSLVHAFGAMEQWNGNLGPGPLNALQATERAMEISRVSGLGCVALSNTNHWMRGGLYGWKAARAGFIFLGWTNTIANMPAWKATDSRLGNNPLVMAIPYDEEAIVLDMAMSQYSFGAIEMQRMKNQLLAVPGGYNKAGEMTKDPVEIMETQKGLPIGYWKGAGLSLLLDLLAAVLSGGSSTAGITQRGTEYGLSQVFIAINMARLGNHPVIAQTIRQVIDDYHQSIPSNAEDAILYPGERVLRTRRQNLQEGIPVLKTVWEKVGGL